MSRQTKRKQDGIKLPFALQKELGLQNGGAVGQGKRRGRGNTIADRKARRKAERGGNHYGRSRIEKRNVEDVQEPEDSDSGLEEELKGKHNIYNIKSGSLNEAKATGHVKALPAQQPKPILKKTRTERNSPSPESFISDPSRESSPELVLDPNSASFRQHAAKDDAEIAALERRLGLKGRNKSKLGDDMLDFVLGGLEDESESKKRKREGRDWLDRKRTKLDKSSEDDHEPSDDESDSSDYQLSEDKDGTSEENESAVSRSDIEEQSDVPEELEDSQFEKSDDAFAGFDSDVPAKIEDRPVKKMRENPYVAPVTSRAMNEKYVPPSLRKREEGNNSGLEALRRQLQGQLNKLSEANMISILGEVEKVYRTNARQDVTTVLINLVLTLFCIRSALQNTFIILHAAFVAALYKVMGTDFGAELLVRLVDRFDNEYRSDNTGKEALNLISLLANLFTFGLVSSHLIYDFIREFISEFSENNAELLLRVVRDCGPQLRSDDPTALKSIVRNMQDISADFNKKGQQINIRTRVMMDTIMDLKNNKMKNATNAAGVTGEHITRMRKALGSLSNRTLKATEPLRITKDDIANSDKKGKWWLVGASWKGHEEKLRDDFEAVDVMKANGNQYPANEDVDLLALAKQYRMNTDVRRSIFVAIMSANDSRDAQTRLVKLRLSTKQEQEIAKVLLRCARAEPTYNPYYAILAKNLCKDNKKVRIGFQFGLWDFFGRIGEKADDDDSDDGRDESSVELHEIVNVAKLYAYLIYHNHLTIGVLKTLNIGFLKEQAVMFLEILLIAIMTQPKAGEEELLRLFSRAIDTPQIVKGLRYFLKKSVRTSDLVGRKDKHTVKEGCRIADTALKMVDSVAIE